MGCHSWDGRAQTFLEMYVLPTRLKRHLEERGDPSPDEMKQVDVLISNFYENYHAAIENGFWPYLDAIKNRDFRNSNTSSNPS
jgi:hypothetical protein